MTLADGPEGNPARRRRDRRGEAVARLLEPGEHARWLVPCQTGLHPMTLLLVGLLGVMAVLLTLDIPWLQVTLISSFAFAIVAVMTTARYRVLAITEGEVVVMRTRPWRPGTPVELLIRLERTWTFEPRKAVWSQITVGAERLWVHKRYHQMLHDSDAELGPAARADGRALPSSGAYRANRAKRKIKHTGRGRR